MRTYLCQPSEADAGEFARLSRDSIAYHRPWVYPPTTERGFIDFLRRIEGDRNVSFLVRTRAEDELVGVVNLNEIIRGALLSGFVGYWGFAASASKGYMSEGVAQSFDYAFSRLGMHRLEINIQPTNTASLALALRLGLAKEGFSPRYLKIGGEWRDHERWAMLSEDWQEAGGAAHVLGRLAR